MIDGVAKDYTDLRDENLAGAELIRVADDRLDDHDLRIKQLETVVSAL